MVKTKVHSILRKFPHRAFPQKLPQHRKVSELREQGSPVLETDQTSSKDQHFKH